MENRVYFGHYLLPTTQPQRRSKVDGILCVTAKKYSTERKLKTISSISFECMIPSIEAPQSRIGHFHLCRMGLRSLRLSHGCLTMQRNSCSYIVRDPVGGRLDSVTVTASHILLYATTVRFGPSVNGESGHRGQRLRCEVGLCAGVPMPIGGVVVVILVHFSL